MPVEGATIAVPSEDPSEKRPEEGSSREGNPKPADEKVEGDDLVSLVPKDSNSLVNERLRQSV
jgi:hypothetical protein